MAEKPHSRRKFLKYAGAGIVAAAAGLSYLTKDYWYATLRDYYEVLLGQFFPKPKGTPTPTVESTLIETTTPTPTQSSTLTPEITPMETPSEDEVAIRNLLDTWVEAFNGHDLNKISSLFVEDAKWSTQAGGTNSYTFKNTQEMYQGFRWHADHRSVINNYKIEEITVLDNKAEVRSSYFYTTDIGGTQKSFAKYTLVKISEIGRGQTKFKLARPIWRISYFQSFM